MSITAVHHGRSVEPISGPSGGSVDRDLFRVHVMRKTKKFSPGHPSLFGLSRSKLENFMNCPRCFYLDRRLGIEPPSGPPFSINLAVDHLLKKEFDDCRVRGVPHPYIAQAGLDAIPYSDARMDDWRNNFKGVRVAHEGSGFEVYGAVDDLWFDRQSGEVIVADYKATAKDGEVSLDADWQISYKRQMEVYQWLLRRNSLKVADTGYFVYCNGDRSRSDFGGVMQFSVKVIPYTGDDTWVEDALLNARHCLDGELPESTPNCKQCAYLSDVKAMGI